MILKIYIEINYIILNILNFITLSHILSNFIKSYRIILNYMKYVFVYLFIHCIFVFLYLLTRTRAHDSIPRLARDLAKLQA